MYTGARERIRNRRTIEHMEYVPRLNISQPLALEINARFEIYKQKVSDWFRRPAYHAVPY